ncbi:hypothetical protein B0I35DRAFT_20201 [Stachybotrys elegans]|uniref:HTH CENPB-type domain-containing protein n=1 Tax=Stachybotrys elegans TaxID=80388 RepID=A0A8K0SYM9_9HYPO|nr:hypothetical protein B0I35DRAFT_20201 [Stachybotrys elegans]
MEQAKLFAHASGNQESVLPSLNSNWLLKFKQKHAIGGNRLMRRASETNIPDSARLSTALPVLKTSREKLSGGISPASPTGQLSPLSGSRSDEELNAGAVDFDFTYRPTASQSTTSLTSDLRDTASTSFSGAPLSPTASFNFSPDANVGSFPLDQNMQMGSNNPDFHHREKRSNTFPSLNIDYVNQSSGNSTEPMTPRNQHSGTAPSSAVDSPRSELQPAPFALDTSLTSPSTLHRSSSNPSMAARNSATPVSSSALSNSVDSSPVSPSQEDARRAANTLLSYIQSMSSNGQFDQSEYMAVVQLTKKLQIHQLAAARPSMGGLSRIPEGDTEMPQATEVLMESS